MENARTTSSAAGRAAPPSATCPMVTHGRPARGRGGAQGGGSSALVPGRRTLPDPGTIGSVRRMEPDRPELPSLGPRDTKASLSRSGGEWGEVREAPTPSCS